MARNRQLFFLNGETYMLLSVIFQIVGNFLLVVSIISQPLYEISKNSSVIVSEFYKREKITKNYKTKINIIVGLIYVIIGLVFSIPCINSYIIKVSLFSTCCFNVILFFILFIITNLVEKVFICMSKEKIDKAVNYKHDGEMWIGLDTEENID
ncbi:MAG: hypothetical protein UH788_04885 [Treponemataceae bacterium]|nr:hypothetical protein [Treponemataceae bacterium]